MALSIQARSLPPEVIRARLEAQVNREVASRPLTFTEEEFKFTIPSGKVLTARLLVPSKEEGVPARLPVLSVFGGFERAEKLLELVHPKVPVIVATFEYPFDAPQKFEMPGSLKYAPHAKQAVADMFDAIEELHKTLRQRDDVDASKISVLGASFGVPFALGAAAADPSISGVVLVHGFGDVPGTVEYQLIQKWKPRYGVFARPVAWMLSRLGWFYLDAPAPEQSARRLTSRQRVLVISAETDSYVPTAASNRLWEALESSSSHHERFMTPGDHVEADSEELIETIAGQVTAWLSRSELL